MKKTYQKPELEVAKFCFSEHVAASGVVCYPIYSNTDYTGDHICDTAPIKVGQTN